MPFSMKKYAHNQCRRRADANIPGPRLTWLYPVGWIAVVVQSGHVGANPDSNICCHIEIPRSRIWLVLIDRRSPVNRNATQKEAEQYWYIQPVAPANRQMVPLDHEHMLLMRQRSRRVLLITSGC